MRDDRVCGFAKAPLRKAAPSHSRDSHRQLDRAGTIAFARTSRPTPYVSSSAASDSAWSRSARASSGQMRSSAARVETAEQWQSASRRRRHRSAGSSPKAWRGHALSGTIALHKCDRPARSSCFIMGSPAGAPTLSPRSARRMYADWCSARSPRISVAAAVLVSALARTSRSSRVPCTPGRLGSFVAR